MGFVVEDGNGLPTANSYASVQQFKDFAEFRVGVTIPDDDTDIMKALVTATGWIDSNYASRFKGIVAFGNQALVFPRVGYIFDDGLQVPLGYMPPALIKATCILAVEAAKGDPLYKNADGAARVIVEDSVGPLIKKYAPSSPAQMVLEKQFPEVEATLYPLFKGFGALVIERA